MVSRGLADFVELLVSLDLIGITGECVYGKCPDCHQVIDGADPCTLIGELLAHELLAHPEHAER